MNIQYKNRSYLYSSEEIENLIKKDRLILFYQYQVVDVTDYKHPGGVHFFNENLKKDIQKLFLDQGHSQFAKILIENLRIGYLNQKGIDKDSDLFKMHQKLDKKIDITKPLLPQVVKLNREEYLAFLDRPMHASSEDAIQMHENKFLDFLLYKSYLPMNICIMIPIIIYALTCSLNNFNLNTIFELLFTYLFGIIFWTFHEYIGHRYFLHGKENLPDITTKKDIQKAFERHQCHHAIINQKYRMCIMFHEIIIIVLIFNVIFKALNFSLFFRLRFISGWATGQLIYDCIHHYIHFSGHEKTWQILQNLKDAHMRHHYRHKHKEFGVSNHFWDRIFGSL